MLTGSEALYFSLITLTTVGYGDIVPTSSVVRMMAGHDRHTLCYCSDCQAGSNVLIPASFGTRRPPPGLKRGSVSAEDARVGVYCENSRTTKLGSNPVSRTILQ